jgi:LAGLIDADG endonuclease
MKIKTIYLTFFMSQKLDAQWIVGFTDGEGCFNIDIHLNPRTKWGIQIQPEFTVVQNEIDEQVLYGLKSYFECGSITVNRKDHTGVRKMWRVKSIEHCHDKILVFFEKHKLRTKKQIEFERFAEIVRLMKQGYHTESLNNFLEIIEKANNLRVRTPYYVSKNQTNQTLQRIEELREMLQEN